MLCGGQKRIRPIAAATGSAVARMASSVRSHVASASTSHVIQESIVKKTYPLAASAQSFREAKQAMPSAASQRVAVYVRTGMATIYRNDKATENEVADRAAVTQDQTHGSARL